MKLNKNAIVSSALHCDKCGADYGIRLPDTYEEYQARLLALVGWKCSEIARVEGRDSDCDGVLLNEGEARQACLAAYTVSFPLYRFFEWIEGLKAKVLKRRVEYRTVRVHWKHNREEGK
ncbi:MAG: hypothetical protein MdMp014T_1887 [Treponematales bacterium]